MSNPPLHRQATLPHFRSHRQTQHTMPKQIGPYPIDSTLSKGNLSFLYLATHPDKQEPLIVKVLSPHLTTHQEVVAQFLKEAHIIQIADHPNIVKLYGQGEWEQGLYIAMEFIQGVSLKQFILQQSLSLKRSIDIVLQVSYALLHLHTHGVIHRDIKPENILLTESGQIKVVDFGIAQLACDKDSPSLEKYGQWIGTPSYMSPEQKKDPLDIDVNADIYSLGIVGYELITGKLSNGDVQTDLLPKNIRPIIQKMLQPLAKERYQDIVDVIQALSAYLKSPGFQKDRSGEDEKREFWEQIQQLQQEFISIQIPRWHDLEIGVGKPATGYLAAGMCYDFIKLPDNSYIVFLAYEENNEIRSIAHLSSFRGMFRAMLDLHIYQREVQLFRTEPFISQLNDVMARDELHSPLHFTFIHFYPPTNEFAFVSSEGNSLWYLSEGSRPRLLQNDSVQIGKRQNEVFHATKNVWRVEDHVVLHTFVHPQLSPSVLENFNVLAADTIIAYHHLSATAKAQAIYKQLAASAIGESSTTKLVLSFQRLD